MVLLSLLVNYGLSERFCVCICISMCLDFTSPRSLSATLQISVTGFLGLNHALVLQ